MNTHRTDSISLVFGVVFLAVAAGWLTYTYAEPQLPHAGWFVAGAAVLLGVAGLAGALVPNRQAKPAADNLNE